MTGRWRTGGHWGRTIIVEGTGEPDEQGRREGDRLIGVMDTPELAELVVTAVNALPELAEQILAGLR